MARAHIWTKRMYNQLTVTLRPIVPLAMLAANTGEKQMLQSVGYMAEAIDSNATAI